MRRRRRHEGAATTNGALTLDAVERNSRVRVLRVTGRPLLMQRLSALGVVPGVAVTVVKAHSPAIVSMGGARIAIGQSAAQSVQVEMVDE